MERMRGVTVKKLDLGPLCERVLRDVREYLDGDVKGVRFGFELALGVDARGRHHLVVSEGVSWPVGPSGPVRPPDSFGPVDLDVFESAPGEIHMMPVATVDVGLQELEALPFEEVDLADFIRQFGARLEVNFREQYEILTQP